MNAPTAVVPRDNGTLIESVIVKGDLGKLTPAERTQYYMEVCKSVGLNPLTKPFEYITLNGKLTLYALRGCTDQLRAIHKVSVVDLTETERDGVVVVTAKLQNGEGRLDMAKGAVTIANLRGDALANAIMKAETKAKRRATLSLCGLSFLDETEVETIPQANIGPPKRTRTEIQASAKMKRDELGDRIPQDLAQITSLRELERYKAEVLTPEFMAKLGNGQWGAEEMVARREAELKGDDSEPVTDEPADGEIESAGQVMAFDECKDWLNGAENTHDLEERAGNQGYTEAIKGLTVAQRNALRKVYKQKLEQLRVANMHPIEMG